MIFKDGIDEVECSKVIKGTNFIKCYDENNNIIKEIKGINDFSNFTLENGEFTTEENLIDKLILDNLNMQMQIDSLIASSLGGN